MSEVWRFEECFATLEKLKESSEAMSNDYTELKQQKAKLLMDNRTISDANKSLQDAMHKLLSTHEKQRTMLNVLDQTLEKNKLLEIELNDLKKEHFKLKNSLKNNPRHIIKHPYTGTDESIDNKLVNYNSLLQKRIADLEQEKQTLIIQTQDPNFRFSESYKQISNLKTKYNTLLLENKSLKGELLNFRNLYNQIIPEIRLNYMNSATSGTGKENVNLFNMMDAIIHNELQPLQVNVKDIDDEDDPPALM